MGDVGGVSRSCWLSSCQFLGVGIGSVSFFGVSGLGRLGGRFGVEGSLGEADRGPWDPRASPY